MVWWKDRRHNGAIDAETNGAAELSGQNLNDSYRSGLKDLEKAAFTSRIGEIVPKSPDGSRAAPATDPSRRLVSAANFVKLRENQPLVMTRRKMTGEDA